MLNTIIPAPISWPPSSYWDGNDGSWNSFIVEIGTPPQSFRVFPSTAGQEAWIPVPDGCTSAEPSNPGYCGFLRGAISTDGVNSSGFETNSSSTWQDIGIFTLDAQENQLGYGGNGLFGFDTVVWGENTSSPNLTHSVVAGIADPDFWVGLVGIGPKPSNFSTFNDPISCYMSRLVNDSKITSLSWGYTAGAAYRNKAPASLTLGGYDTTRFEAPGLSLAMASDNSRPLQVAVQKILTQNSLMGTVNLLPTAIYEFVDSTVPHIWLPDDAIGQFVAAFGLTYDNKTDLYLVNDTTHDKLSQLNPTITFVLANSTFAGASNTMNIDFSYAAFDLNASYPFYQNATRYFPIRRAANESQYTIGRTFFQEAYVIADFERSNFTVAQTTFPTDTAPQHLVAITKPSATTSQSATPSPDSTTSLTTGETVGITVGAIAALAIIALLAWLLFRRRRRQKQGQIDVATGTTIEKTSDPYTDGTYEESGFPEVEGEYNPLAIRSEVDGHHAKWSKYGVQELYTPPIGGLSEAPGDEGVRYELSGSPH